MKKIFIIAVLSLFGSLVAENVSLGDTAWAVMEGNEQEVRAFIEAGGDVNATVEFSFPPLKTTLFHLAIDNLQPKIAAMLLDAGAEANTTDSSDHSTILDLLLLIYVLEKSHKTFFDSITALILKKERIGDFVREVIFLMVAIRGMTLETARSITIGRLAIKMNRQRLVEQLYALLGRILSSPHLSIKHESIGELSPLHIAVLLENKELVSQLIEHGANPHQNYKLVMSGDMIAPGELAEQLSRGQNASPASREIAQLLKPQNTKSSAPTSTVLRRLRVIAGHLIDTDETVEGN